MASEVEQTKIKIKLFQKTKSNKILFRPQVVVAADLQVTAVFLYKKQSSQSEKAKGRLYGQNHTMGKKSQPVPALKKSEPTLKTTGFLPV